MNSDDSDDEPLSILAAAKKASPEKFNTNVTVENEIIYEPKRKKRKVNKNTTKSPFKKLPVTFNFGRKLNNALTAAIIQRPNDVWLYLKDLNAVGPYSCLLCPEWFINKSKIIIHYVLNHQKDFCGICRYFVPDREAWEAHQNFHTPWPCSQCIENFPTEGMLRLHLSSVHKLVHCRLCHFRVSDDDQYNTHLFQKHNVTNVSSKYDEALWELEYEGSPKFLCLLCAKSNNMSSTFFNHYMGFHHFTLKCFSSLISGKDPPFKIYGADVSAEFIEALRSQGKCGYVDLNKKPIEEPVSGQGSGNSNILVPNVMEILMPEIKQEALSDVEDLEEDQEQEILPDHKQDKVELETLKAYKGDEDFDVTLMELVVLQQCYFDYISQTLQDLTDSIVPEISDIDYEKAKSDITLDVDCSLCQTKYNTVQTFTGHMLKMHSVKAVAVYTCRVCATTFDTQNDLDLHTVTELGDFIDLWICQFCDKEFDNREATRRHLTEHMEVMEYDNCFSPHLGFKCKFCPTLFWNEPDRELHQVRAHFNKYKDQYYKCEHCFEVYSDKVWFIYHYLLKHHKEEMKNAYLLKCCICCLVLSTVEEMRSHFNSEHPEAKKIFCSLDSCQYRPLSHKKSFAFHVKTQHSSEVRKDRAVCCSICGREFPSSRALSAHMSQVHGPGKFKCKICKEMLHSMDERKLHYLIRHPGHHPFECAECGKSFQYKSSLYMHKQEHSPNKQSYTCNYCQKVFMKKDSFREHVQIHEGPRHACSYCPMRFVQRSNMLRHERRHTGERPYACQHCPRTFADKGACNSHSRIHSKDQTPYSCMYCGQTFVQKSKLTYHTRKHTGENLETCTICSKLFTSACSLREHMKVHAAKMNKDSVKCPLCDRTYQDERYMLRHLRSTHTHGVFKCPLCRKGLTSAAGLRHHVITHSPLNVFRCKSCPKTYAVKRTMVKHLRKRHNVKQENMKEYYTKIEPKDCQLGLDDDVLNSIFGPPKKRSTDVLIGDFVTIKAPLAVTKKESSDEETEEENEDKEGDNDNFKESDEESIDAKPNLAELQGHDNSVDEELEPTDFVSVKIEPVDEEENPDE